MRPVLRVASLLQIPSPPIGNLKQVYASNYRPIALWVGEQRYIKRNRSLHTPKTSSWSIGRARHLVLSGPTLRRANIDDIPRIRKYSTDTKNRINTSRDDLPSQEEGRRSHLSRRFSNIMDHMQSNIFLAGQRLNDLTGYSGIEALKKDIEEQELTVQSTRTALQEARIKYSTAISSRSSSQREVNTLLQRKHAWDPADLERFTALYRSDHANEQAEASARDHLTAAEKATEEAAARLSTSILARYHEEQIWSDKIRRMSTWGTWGLMGVNVLLFLVFQIAVEPWRRKRLVKGFEEKVSEALDREAGVPRAALDAISEEMGAEAGKIAIRDSPSTEAPEDQVEDPPVVPTSAVAESTVPPVGSKSASSWEGIRETLRDMFSEQQISVRRVDLTTAMLEGAAAGVAFVGMIVLLLRPR